MYISLTKSIQMLKDIEKINGDRKSILSKIIGTQEESKIKQHYSKHIKLTSIDSNIYLYRIV